MQQADPIGIFDSGVGGLTVYRALRLALPHEDFVYFGDIARLPYGTKSKEMLAQYTIEAAHFLSAHHVKYFVIACNTASAYGLDAVQKELPQLAYCGVISAGAEAAIKVTRTGRIAVLATEATVRSGVYPDVIRSLRGDANVQMLACGLLVTLTEEGWLEGTEAEAIVARYLSMLSPGYDTLVLGCTHFPLLLPIFRKLCPADVAIVDVAQVTAQAVAGLLSARGLLNGQTKEGTNRFFVSDMSERFSTLGAKWLGLDIARDVSLSA